MGRVSCGRSVFVDTILVACVLTHLYSEKVLHYAVVCVIQYFVHFFTNKLLKHHHRIWSVLFTLPDQWSPEWLPKPMESWVATETLKEETLLTILSCCFQLKEAASLCCSTWVLTMPLLGPKQTFELSHHLACFAITTKTVLHTIKTYTKIYIDTNYYKWQMDFTVTFTSLFNLLTTQSALQGFFHSHRFTHSHTEAKMTTAHMKESNHSCTQTPIRRSLGFSTLTKDTLTHRLEEWGIELTIFWLLGDLLPEPPLIYH